MLDRRADDRSAPDATPEPIPNGVRRHAVLASFGAHAVLVLVVARAHWIEAPTAPRVSIPSGWIVLPQPQTSAPEDEPPPVSRAPEPEPAAAAVPQPAAPPPARTRRATPSPPASAAPAPPAASPAPVPTPPRVDWEAERRRAIAALSAEGEHKRDFSPSTAPASSDDFARHPPPTGAIFDAHVDGGSALAPGQARTRLGNALRGACNALLGGFSVLGFGRFCAENRPTNYLILDVRPDYLLTLPECTEPAADAPAFEARDGIPYRSAKCKLVPKEWRARTGAQR